MLQDIEREEFETLKGKTVTVSSGDYQTEFRVLESGDVGGYTQRPKPSFRVWFGAALDCRLRQGLLRIDHPTRGALEIFVTCLGPDRECMRYEAIFN